MPWQFPQGWPKQLAFLGASQSIRGSETYLIIILDGLAPVINQQKLQTECTCFYSNNTRGAKNE